MCVCSGVVCRRSPLFGGDGWRDSSRTRAKTSTPTHVAPLQPLEKRQWEANNNAGAARGQHLTIPYSTLLDTIHPHTHTTAIPTPTLHGKQTSTTRYTSTSTSSHHTGPRAHTPLPPPPPPPTWPRRSSSSTSRARPSWRATTAETFP